MTTKKLFKVEVSITAMVLADDCFQARRVASANIGDITSDQDIDYYTNEITSTLQMDTPEEDSIPYGADNEDDPDLTCGEIFEKQQERKAAEEQAKKDKELEDRIQVNIFSDDLKKAEGLWKKDR